MAPEQTGRMDRAVDARSDLYSLGVILYQLATGELPFNADDPMQWIHCHVAREAVAPRVRRPGGNATVSKIIMRLLAKSHKQRYQSAAGLAADPQQCVARLDFDGRIAPFEPGMHDASARQQVPLSNWWGSAPRCGREARRAPQRRGQPAGRAGAVAGGAGHGAAGAQGTGRGRGLYALVSAIVGYFAVIDINLSAGSLKTIAAQHASGDSEQIGQTIGFGLMVYGALAGPASR